MPERDMGGGQKMMVGDKYILSGASQLGVTREGKEVKIPPLSVIEKIRDNFADKLKFRNMFVLCKTGQEIDISQSIIERYFIPYTKDGG